MTASRSSTDANVRPRLSPAVGFGLGLLLLLLATRLPRLVGGAPVLDGDESILALMAKHAAEGEGVELFFYGQSFGLAVFESLAVAAFFLLFGISAASAKSAILCLWALGSLALILAVRKLAGARAAGLAAVLVVLCPAWGTWSMMARGYHVAGFTLTGLCLWGLACLGKSERPRAGISGVLGIGLGSLVLTQAIGFLSLAPIAVRVFWSRRFRSDLLAVAIGFLATLGTVYLATVGRLSDSWSPAFFTRIDPLEAVTRLPERIWVFFGGEYSYGTWTAPGPLTSVAAALWSLALVVAGYRLLVTLVKRERLGFAQACLLGILLVLALSLLVNNRRFGFRYFLPVAGLLIVFLAAETARFASWTRRARLVTVLGLAALGLSGLGAILEAPYYRPSPTLERTALTEGESMQALVDDLSAAGVRHVYSLHPTFQWKIIFTSRERILARWIDPDDRRPEYPRAVDRALLSGEPVALVGKPHQWERARNFLERQGYPLSRVRVSGGRYFWVPDPGARLVRTMGFRFSDPG